MNGDLRNMRSKSCRHVGERTAPSHERSSVKELGGVCLTYLSNPPRRSGGQRGGDPIMGGAAEATGRTRAFTGMRWDCF